MNRKSEIIQKLRNNLEDTVSYFRNLSEDQLEEQIYDHGAQWTTRQVLAHLITIEISMHKLFNNMLEGGNGAPSDFDLERYNRSQPPKLEEYSIDELAGLFKHGRLLTISIVENMKDEDLDRTGRHAYHGSGTLEKFIRWAYEHPEHHIQVLKERLQ